MIQIRLMIKPSRVDQRDTVQGILDEYKHVGCFHNGTKFKVKRGDITHYYLKATPTRFVIEYGHGDGYFFAFNTQRELDSWYALTPSDKPVMMPTQRFATGPKIVCTHCKFEIPQVGFGHCPNCCSSLEWET